MRFDVSNFRGCHAASIVAAPIALLTGHNGQGKSSIIEALAAAFEGSKQPYGLKKDDMGQMVHDGEETAEVIIQDDDGRKLEARWPAGDFMTTGRPFAVSSIAAGSTLYSDLDPKARLELLARYLKTEPTKDELAALWKERDDKVTDQEVDAMWKQIQKLGWDGALKAEMTAGTELKGAWRQVTKDNYGSKVGGTWRPQGWTNDHEMTTVQTLERERAVAAEELEKVIGKVAINDDEKKRLEATVKNIPKLKQAVEERQTEVSQKEFIKTKAETALKNIPVLPAENWPECPHCRTLLQVMGNNKLALAPAPMNPTQRKKLEDELAQATTVFNSALSDHTAAVNSLDVAKKDLKAAEDSKAALENSDPLAVDPAKIAELREEIQRCESIIAVKNRILQSLQIHGEIMRKSVICYILAPDGLRATKLNESLEAFNAELAALCEVANWAKVIVQPDGSLQRGTRRLNMTSIGEQMQADVIMQIALGMRDGSEVFLVDQADLLDGVGRNGLFALLQHTGQSAVVAMMLLNRKAAPDLAKAEIGQTYWIEQAVAGDLAA